MTVPVFTRGEWEDIGDGVRVRRVFSDGELEAIDWDHQCPVIQTADYLHFGGAYGWTLQATEPLTISPSLLCRACQRHGFIKRG
jgi:hypothetical protein